MPPCGAALLLGGGRGDDRGIGNLAAGFRGGCRSVDDDCCGYRVHGGWKRGAGESDHHMAGVCDGGRVGGGGGEYERRAWSEWRAQRGARPECGATPAGVYYTVVYQLGPGQVKTE